MSFLSKAYNFLKGKTSAKDEHFSAKSKNPFPSEIYPVLSEPMVNKGLPSISRKNRKVLGEISNRSVISDRERKPQRANLESFSPRALVKNYWTSKGDKKINNEVQKKDSNKISYAQEEDEEEEGIFTTQVCGNSTLFYFQDSKRKFILSRVVNLKLGPRKYITGSICLAKSFKDKFHLYLRNYPDQSLLNRDDREVINSPHHKKKRKMPRFVTLNNESILNFFFYRPYFGCKKFSKVSTTPDDFKGSFERKTRVFVYD